MKSRQSQTGSAHLVIVIVLVVVILGLLGFVFWQHFINKPATTTDTTKTTAADQETTKDNATTPTNSKVISIIEWGVKGSYTSDDEYVYSMMGTYSKPNQWTLTRSSISTSCADQPGSVSRGLAGEDAIVGSTSSGKTNKEAYDLGYGTARAHVGDYYYFYTGPQADCSDSSDTAQRAKLVNATVEVLQSLAIE